MDSYTLTEISKLLGIPPRTIDFYTKQNLVVPGIDNPQRRGTTRRYSRRNLSEFLIIRKFFDNGLALKQIKKIMDAARNNGIDKDWDPDSRLAKAERGTHEWPILLVEKLDTKKPSVKIVGKIEGVYKGMFVGIALDEIFTIINEL